MRILIAEDDTSISSAIAVSLRAQGHAVDVATDGSCADRGLASGHYELVVLDLGLPALDGTHVLQRHRARGGVAPVLVITARADVDDRVHLLDLGADDYLVKPFALGEFGARVRALIRRATNRGADRMRIGRLTVDVIGKRAVNGEQNLDLTRREFGMLSVLATRLDRVTSREQLTEAVCDWSEDLTDNGLDIAMHRVRRKLQGSGVSIRTIRGLGYLLEEQSGA